MLLMHMGVSENRLVPLNPMVLLIIIPFLNGYFIGNINPTFSDKPTSCHFNLQGSQDFLSTCTRTACAFTGAFMHTVCIYCPQGHTWIVYDTISLKLVDFRRIQKGYPPSSPSYNCTYNCTTRYIRGISCKAMPKTFALPKSATLRFEFARSVPVKSSHT